MKFYFSLFLLSLCLSCEKLCTGHGECQKKDKCECYPGWGAADCSQRSCPYGESYTFSALGDLNHDGNVTKDEVQTQWFTAEIPEKVDTIPRMHGYAECSNSGLCNRETGECECLGGFTGSACQRKTCPSVNREFCSGHGRCLSGANMLSRSPSLYNGWESEKEYGCLCDDGWTGVDCMSRVCTKSFDPTQSSYPNLIIGYQPDFGKPIHVLKVKYGGVVYESHPIVTRRDDKDKAPKLEENDVLDYQEEVRIAVKDMPPLSQSRVHIDKASTQIRIQVEGVDLVTFKDAVVFSKEECPECGIENAGILAQQVDAFECGNRGLCNVRSGLCDCFTGFYGNGCEYASAVNSS